MFLKQVQLENYRCFKSATIELHRRLNVFVGTNGAGKTAVLDAIGGCLEPIPRRLNHQLGSESNRKFPRLLQRSDIRILQEAGQSIFPAAQRSAPSAGLSATAYVSDPVGRAISWELVKLRDRTKDTARLSGEKSPGLVTLHEYCDNVAENRPRYSFPIFARYPTSRMAKAMPHQRELPMPGGLGTYDGALDSNVDFRRAVGWFDFFEQLEFRRQRDSGVIAPFAPLEAVRSALTSIFPEMSKPRIDAHSKQFVVNVETDEGVAATLELQQLSDGYQVMLGLVMDFALRLAMANPPQRSEDDVLASEAILIIDEIDLHLHPEWQQRVIPDLQRTFPNTQLIVSTHSPQVLSTVDADSIKVIRREKGTRVITTPAFQTKGVESAAVLAEIMGVDPEPKVPEAQWLSDYRAMIEDGRADSGEAVALNERLLRHFGPQHPVMLECDRLKRFDQFKRRAVAGGTNASS